MRACELPSPMNSPLRLAVTGRQGQLVRSLLEIGTERGIEVLAVGRPVLELADTKTIEPAIAALKPHVVVSAAGYTDTERAEIEPDIAHVVNVDGAAAVAAAARKLGVPLIHLSSSYVFDGMSTDPYREDEAIAPLGAYAKTKALGETAVAAAQPDHVIVRTSLVFSPFGRNTLTNFLRLAAQHDELQVVMDQTVNPTAASDLAEGILAMARKLVTEAPRVERHGIFHLASRESATPAAFASALFAASAQCGGPSARVIPVTSDQYVSRVRRPPNARLDCSKIAATYGIEIEGWEPRLRMIVERVLTDQR